MKYINTSALALCVLTLVVVCGFVFSTGVNWTRFDYYSSWDGYRCVPNETPVQADDIDHVSCSKLCYVNNQCRSFFYQPDNRKCIGCSVDFFRPFWINRPIELPGSMYFRQLKKQNLTTNCKHILENDPSATSGPYEITEGDTLWKVYCDMTTDGGGWTVFQNRFDGSVDFYRNFSEYENGFGDINGEFWLGLKYVQALANRYPSELMLVLTRADGFEGYEQYSEFKLLDGTDYRLYIKGRWTSFWAPQNRANGYFDFEMHTELAFTTFDRDMDRHPRGNCAVLMHGAWWYSACTVVHLNGKYCTSVTKCTGTPGFYHYAFAGAKEQLIKSKMMIRPKI